jgi:hypothetical protein
MLVGAIEYFDDGLTGSGHPLVLVTEQTQRRLDTARRTRFVRRPSRRLHIWILSPSAICRPANPDVDAIMSHLAC